MARVLYLLSLLAAVSASAATVWYPLGHSHAIRGLVFTDDGIAWESSTAGVRRLEPDGSATPIVSGSFQVTAPVIGPDGAIWVGIGDDLTRIDPDTNAVAHFPLSSWIRGLVVGPDDLLWIVVSPSTLVRMSTSGSIVSTVSLASPLTELFDTHLVQLVAAGGFVWSISGGKLARVEATGATQLFTVPLPPYFEWLASGGDALWLANEPPSASQPRSIIRMGFGGEVLGQFSMPVPYIFGFAADAAGNLWLSEEEAGLIVRMTPDGDSTVMFAVPPANVCSPYGPEPIAVSDDGRVAIGKMYIASAVAGPNDPCFTDPNARAATVIVDLVPAAGHEVPTAGTTALLVLAAALGALGAFMRLR